VLEGGISDDNMLDILVYAHLYSASNLLDVCIKRIIKLDYNTYSTTDEFNNLPEKTKMKVKKEYDKFHEAELIQIKKRGREAIKGRSCRKKAYS